MQVIICVYLGRDYQRMVQETRVIPIPSIYTKLTKAKKQHSPVNILGTCDNK